eukprot:scaffold7420_cov97-Isochrysis_galbana.AAC.9
MSQAFRTTEPSLRRVLGSQECRVTEPAGAGRYKSGRRELRHLRDGARLLDDDEDSVRLAGDCALDQVSRQPAVSLWDVDGLDEPRHERLEPRALERIDEGEALGMGHLGHNLCAGREGGRGGGGGGVGALGWTMGTGGG